MINLKNNFNKNDIVQFIKFGLVGVSNTFVSLIVYYLLIYFSVNYILANIAGFVISVLNAFFWNSKYVFKHSQKGSLVRTYISYGMTFLLSNLLLYGLVEFMNVSKIVAPVLCLVVTIPLNFILNKYWTFK